MKLPVLLLCVAVLQEAAGGDAFAAALRDYRAERYDSALSGFRQVLQAQGDAAAPALRCNVALAALRQRRAADAEAAVQPLLEHADANERAWAEFLLGQAAWQRSEGAAAAARLADAEPMAWQAAVSSAERAVAHWCRAADRPNGWPAALRNAERAHRALADLRRERDASQPTKKQEDAPPPPPAPTDEQPVEEQLPDLQVAPLSPRELATLAERLGQREREKRRVRTVEQSQRGGVGGRDW